ncbi:MAG: hypothetical protein AAGJ40_09335 [Planctomycetota bacterium]
MSVFAYVEESRFRTDRYVSNSHDALMAESHQAVDCLNCEAWLQNGIDLFKYLLKADECIRWASCEVDGFESQGEDVLAIISECLVQWVVTSRQMLDWIRKCEDNGYQVDFKDEFLECLKEAESILDSNGKKEIPEELQSARDDAIREFEAGETQPFVS